MMGVEPKASISSSSKSTGRRSSSSRTAQLFANDIEVAILAMDEGGKVKDGAKDTAQLKLRPETYAAVQKNGMRLTRRLDSRLGSYQLRIGARENNGGLVGSVMYDLDVPDFSKADLSMGGVLLTSASSQPHADGRTPTPTSRRSCRLADAVARVPLR